MNLFYAQYASIQHWLQKETMLDLGKKQQCQSIKEQEKIESPVTADLMKSAIHRHRFPKCCFKEYCLRTHLHCFRETFLDSLDTSCPSYWWNADKYLGPAVLMQAYRWIIDSRDGMAVERLSRMQDGFSAFKCRTIMNCTKTCPFESQAIEEIKMLLTKITTKPAPVPTPATF